MKKKDINAENKIIMIGILKEMIVLLNKVTSKNINISPIIADTK